MSSPIPPQTALPGDPPVTVSLRRSTRARRYSLRVSQLDGKVTLVLPHRAPLAEGLAFLRDKADWVRGQLARQPGVQALRPGDCLPLEGQLVRLAPGAGRAPALRDGRLLVPGDAAQVGRRVQAFLKTTARERLAVASDRYAAALGRPYRRLTLRDTRSRWGSCSPAGDLMYSWRLVMAPAEVLDYVAAHEVAHLAEMNHSPAFWEVVARLCPDYRGHRKWLRDNGGTLHRIRFTD